MIAGLVAHGTTIVTGLSHWKRGYEALDKKLQRLGAHVVVHEAMDTDVIMHEHKSVEKHDFR